ncbi:FHA domain-containing protein [Bacillus cereus]|nr:FHA domain-containing protein [Bacillus cereus]
MGFIKLITLDNEWVLVNELEKKEKVNEDLVAFVREELADSILPFEIEKVKRKTFIKVKLTGKYSVLTRLQEPIDSREIVLILKGITDSMKELTTRNIPFDYVDLDLDFFYVDRETGKIQLTLWALDNLASKTNVLYLFKQIGDVAQPKSSKDKTFLENYNKMFTKQDIGLDKIHSFVELAYKMLEQSSESNEIAKENNARALEEAQKVDMVEEVESIEPVIEDTIEEEVIEPVIEPVLEEPIIEPILEAKEEVASAVQTEVPQTDVEDTFGTAIVEEDEEVLMPTDKTTFLMDDGEDEQDEVFDDGKTTILIEDQEEQIPYLIRESDGEKYELSILRPETSIGKQDTDILIRDNKAISRRHATFRFEEGVVELEDLGSANGTWVNNRKLVKGRKEQLITGDVLKFANEEFTFYEG